MLLLDISIIYTYSDCIFLHRSNSVLSGHKEVSIREQVLLIRPVIVDVERTHVTPQRILVLEYQNWLVYFENKPC